MSLLYRNLPLVVLFLFLHTISLKNALESTLPVQVQFYYFASMILAARALEEEGSFLPSLDSVKNWLCDIIALPFFMYGLSLAAPHLVTPFFGIQLNEILPQAIQITTNDLLCALLLGGTVTFAALTLIVFIVMLIVGTICFVDDYKSEILEFVKTKILRRQ